MKAPAGSVIDSAGFVKQVELKVEFYLPSGSYEPQNVVIYTLAKL